MKTVKLGEFSDKRGNLVENTEENIMLSSRHFFISKSIPGVIRGNHYHKRKTEYFIIVQGKCLIVVEDINSRSKESLEISDSDNLAVLMEPKKAHAIKNIGKNQLILLALVNEKLDHENPDTYPYRVI
jgi:UDP-2-acetamido-2,6-beta-L-arabino-hexul-4-ose reductase